MPKPGFAARARMVALSYVGLGLVSAVAPSRVPAVFGGSAPTTAARTEIRAVYGGIPLAFAAVLAGAARRPDRSRGAVNTVAVATAGMAVARLASAAAEKRFEPWPTGGFALIEAAMAAALVPDREPLPDEDRVTPTA